MDPDGLLVVCLVGSMRKAKLPTESPSTCHGKVDVTLRVLQNLLSHLPIIGLLMSCLVRQVMSGC